MHPLKVIGTYLRLGILNVVQYRADFWFELLTIGINLISALLGVSLVFSQTSSLGGWNRNDLIALVGIQMLVSGLINIVIMPSMRTLMENVRMGTLDFMLTKPADSQLLASVSTVNVGAVASILVGIGVLVTALVRLGGTIGALDWFRFLVVLISGIVIIYGFLLILSTFTFWLVKLDNILVIFETMFNGAGNWPITIYPGWMRASLTFVVPVAFAITIPAQSLTGRLSGEAVLGTVVLAVVFVVVSRVFWVFGLRHYTGASA
jgi:ABC-2 type transport system permease protein